MSRGIAGSALVIWILLFPVAQAQQLVHQTPVVDTGYTVRMAADWVYVNARVWDPKGKKSVDDLGRNDFAIRQDGMPLDVASCLSGTAPFHLLLLMDVSASTSKFNSLIRKAAVHFSDQLQPGDELALVSFNDRAQFLLPFTADRHLIDQAAKSLKSEGGTAFYDALAFALRRMASIDGRKAIVVFSDGADNRLSEPRQGSFLSFEELIDSVRTSDCLIYTIFLQPFETKSLRDNVIKQAAKQMKEIAEQTGARNYSPEKPDDIRHCYGEIAEDLRHIYTLTFTPGLRSSPGWHEISVSLPRHPELLVLSRKGYGTREKAATVGAETE